MSQHSQAIPLENVIDTTDNCRYCLMCRHVCPVGHITHLETLTPHGWGLIIASVRRRQLEWNASSIKALYSCADCGTCRANCVTDQRLPDAIAIARAETVKLKLAPPVVYEVEAALRQWGNPYKKQAPRVVNSKSDVAVFVGDDAEYLWPGEIAAAVTLLNALGVEPALFGQGRNNGYLATSLGLPEVAKCLAEANLEDLRASEARHLLVLTPGDLFTFGQLYSERLEIPFPQGLILQELAAFLADKLELGVLRLKQSHEGVPWAYLDPTHSGRVTTRYAAPRRLLAAALEPPTIELFWRQQRTHTCGDTALRYTNPSLSDRLATARLEDAVRSGARMLITEDPGCLSQLSQRSSRFGVSVHGLYDLLAAHLA